MRTVIRISNYIVECYEIYDLNIMPYGKKIRNLILFTVLIFCATYPIYLNDDHEKIHNFIQGPIDVDIHNSFHIRQLGEEKDTDSHKNITFIHKQQNETQNAYFEQPGIDEIVRRNSGKISVSVIVNHCTEDLQWIPFLFKPKLQKKLDLKVYIYEKCGLTSVFNLDYVSVATLPNVGREGHTWLTHIFQQTPHFSDFNIFLQGQKETNSRIIRKTTYSYVNNWKNESRPFWMTLQFLSCPFTFRGISRRKHSQAFCNWVYLLIGTKDRCGDLIASFRGEWIANRAALVEAYEKHKYNLHKIYATLNSTNNPVTGHYLERLWYLIFKGPDYSCHQKRKIKKMFPK